MSHAEEPYECESNDSPWLVCVRCRAAGKCLLAEEAREKPAKQEPLTEDEIWNIQRNLGGWKFLSGETGARAIESACAKKWGVSLG